MPRFLFTRRWILLFVTAVFFAVLFVGLGIWQLHRLSDRRAFNAAVERGLHSAVVPIDQALPAGSENGDAAAYRRAEATGTYDTAHEVVLFGRALNGEPGSHVLTPLVLTDGRAVIVDRGWVPIEDDHPPVAAAAPPAGTVMVTGVLWPPEKESTPGTTGSTPLTTVTRIDLGQLGSRLTEPVVPLYLRLQTQVPVQPGGIPRRVPLPELSEGPHLNYAFQWFTFALMALVGFVILAVRESRRERRA